MENEVSEGDNQEMAEERPNVASGSQRTFLLLNG